MIKFFFLAAVSLNIFSDYVTLNCESYCSIQSESYKHEDLKGLSLEDSNSLSKERQKKKQECIDNKKDKNFGGGAFGDFIVNLEKKGGFIFSSVMCKIPLYDFEVTEDEIMFAFAYGNQRKLGTFNYYKISRKTLGIEGVVVFPNNTYRLDEIGYGQCKIVDTENFITDLKENALPFLKEGCDFDYKKYKNQKIKNQF